MNCQRFETAINDLARDQMMDAATRVRAQAHASDCARCAARLADERMLTAGLRRLAASADDITPARVEARLLAAFREQYTASPALAPTIARARRWPRAALAAAAAVIFAALAFAGIRFAPARAMSAIENATQVERAMDWQSLPRVIAALSPAHDPHKIVVAVPQEVQSVPVTAPRRERRPQPAPPVVEDVNATTEIATDFIPLIHGDNLTLLEEGQMMRVELPRTALLAFGLPMNPERADERIKADVVIGSDGLARAIRFVR